MNYYRDLRFSNITSPKFRHLLLLLYWPLYGFVFWLLELVISLDYTAIESALDAKIPFCEFFVIPYCLWYVYLVGIHLYTLFFDIKAFKRLMYFITITFTVTLIIYVVFPNMQQLRPTEFKNDNILVDIARALHAIDTNTNVCPSLHVIGSFAVLFASFNCKGLDSTLPRLLNIIATLIISISTVFMKQHSVIDIYAAVALCFITLPVVYILPDKIKKTA